ncbi:MFS transporter [Paraburkholderia susongensis]|uniref:MFS transporter, AAHS family, 4-hydroxybenzoate transporter n=1 Tax=Paraburkholderia susongensis TaxID=1515439 RepID=A0A1X7JHG0_9BURK|nr:MFS transporter [Paraburkholderia susongensis]SMG26718.1 MFS transporter, AAHS family, 4-hydroxybenzoate transporter [Paraburkholderia susongensis]
MNVSEKMSLETLIDSRPIGAFQIRVIALCSLIAMMDGFDMQSIAFVAPELAAQWRIAPQIFGVVFSAGLLGGLIGAIAFGRIGDRKGRKVTLLYAMSIVAAGTLATPLATSVSGLIAVLFFSGIGLGGAMPNFIALTTEYSPGPRRATLVAMMFCGFPFGAVVGGMASAYLIPLFGWRSVFLLGGLLALLILPAAARWLPESARFLALRNEREKIAPIVARMNGTALWNGEVGAVTHVRSSVASLLADGRAPGTMLLWTTTFLSMFMLYMLINWIPMMARRSGFGIESAVIAVSMFNLGGIVGSITLGRLADGAGGLPRVIGCAYWIGAGIIASITYVAHSAAALFFVAFAAGFFSMGAQLCTVALSASFYETFLRATGIGCAMAAGRTGAIVGPVFGGMLLASGVGFATLFAMAGATSFSAGAAVLALLLIRARSRSGDASGVPAAARETS